MMPETVEQSVLKQSRQACHKARDDFFACVSSCELEYTRAISVPSKCSKARKAYERLCRDSWVLHFDTIKERETKYHQRVRELKAEQAAKAAAAAVKS